MYPSKCRVCDALLKSKNQATHHNRLCKRLMAEQIAAVISFPVNLTVVATFAKQIELTVYRNQAREKFEVRCVKKDVDESYKSAEEAAAVFLSYREELADPK